MKAFSLQFYVSAKDDTIPDPLPLMDSINTKLIGIWEPSLIQNRKLFVSSHRQSIFSGINGKIEFTNQKGCIVTKSGHGNHHYSFFTNNQKIILDNHGSPDHLINLTDG